MDFAYACPAGIRKRNENCCIPTREENGHEVILSKVHNLILFRDILQQHFPTPYLQDSCYQMNSADAVISIFITVMCLSMAITAGITPELKTQFRILCELVVYISTIGVVNLACQGALNQFGIRPRTPIGLLGILLAPFLHGSWTHLLGNAIAFFILGWLVMLGGADVFFLVTTLTALTSGLGIWLFGSTYSIHVGVSGVVFGYLGFLLSHGYLENNPLSFILSALVGGLYGSKLMLVFPVAKKMSWEGHLFGLLGGVLVASNLDLLKAIFLR